MAHKTPIENVRLAFACDKNWDAMPPCPDGKRCQSCQTTVIDFTEKSLADLQAALQNGGELCGRFSRSQLAPALPPTSSSFRKLAAGVLIALGFTSLGNELKAQVTPPPDLPQTHSDNDKFYGVFERMPEYKHGGQAGMHKFIQENIAQPQAPEVEGVVVVSFVIDTTGAVTEPQILKGLSEEIDQEVLRVVRLLEFIPGRQGDRKAPTKYTVPVRFNAEQRKKKK